ncbi:hypothetical protein ACOME3_002187 [Neoechinorhynchus agilis]
MDAIENRKGNADQIFNDFRNDVLLNAESKEKDINLGPIGFDEIKIRFTPWLQKLPTFLKAEKIVKDQIQSTSVEELRSNLLSIVKNEEYTIETAAYLEAVKDGYKQLMYNREIQMRCIEKFKQVLVSLDNFKELSVSECKSDLKTAQQHLSEIETQFSCICSALKINEHKKVSKTNDKGDKDPFEMDDIFEMVSSYELMKFTKGMNYKEQTEFINKLSKKLKKHSSRLEGEIQQTKTVFDDLNNAAWLLHQKLIFLQLKRNVHVAAKMRVDQIKLRLADMYQSRNKSQSEVNKTKDQLKEAEELLNGSTVVQVACSSVLTTLEGILSDDVFIEENQSDLQKSKDEVDIALYRIFK